jgi:hypothetical protein
MLDQNERHSSQRRRFDQNTNPTFVAFSARAMFDLFPNITFKQRGSQCKLAKFLLCVSCGSEQAGPRRNVADDA